MNEVFFSIQALLAAILLGVAIERGRALLFVAPVSRRFMDALSDALEARAVTCALALSNADPKRWVNRIVLTWLHAEASDRDERMEMELGDLRMEAGARLTLLRVSATISSTLGLLGGILAIQRGFSGKGLLSLSAGLAQQVALNQALSHMAVGMGTAAFCFAAFNLFRTAARDALTQTKHITARCRGALRAEPTP